MMFDVTVLFFLSFKIILIAQQSQKQQPHQNLNIMTDNHKQKQYQHSYGNQGKMMKGDKTGKKKGNQGNQGRGTHQGMSSQQNIDQLKNNSNYNKRRGFKGNFF